MMEALSKARTQTKAQASSGLGDLSSSYQQMEKTLLKVDDLSTNLYIVDTPNFVSNYRLESVVNDSDLLTGRDFTPLTHCIDG